MNIDFQISAAALVQSLINTVNRRLWGRPFCAEGVHNLSMPTLPPSTVPGVYLSVEAIDAEVRTSSAEDPDFGFQADERTVVHDLLHQAGESEQSSFRQRPVIVSVTLHIRAATLADLATAGVDNVPPANVINYFARYTAILNAEVDRRDGVDAAAIRYEFHSLGFGFGPNGPFLPDDHPLLNLDPDIRTSVREQVEDLSPLSFDLGSIVDMLSDDGTFRLWNVGTSFDETAITIRAQISESPAAIDPPLPDREIADRNREIVESWNAFFTSDVASFLGEDDWGTLMPTGMFATVINGKIREGIRDRDDVRIGDGGIDSRWTLQDGAPGITTIADMEVIDACPLINTDIGAEVTVVTRFSLSRPGVFRFDVHVDHDLTDSDVILCGLALGVVAGIAVIPVIGVFGGIYAAIIGGVVVTVGVFVTTIVVASVYPTPSLEREGSDLKKVEGSENSYYQEEEIKFDVGESGLSPQLTTITGRADGLVLSGSVGGRAIRGPELSVSADLGFQWGSLQTCSNRREDEGAIETLTLRNEGVAGLRICHVEQLDVGGRSYPPEEFSIVSPRRTEDISARASNRSIRIRVSPAIVDRVLSRPPSERTPFRILVQTNGGARVIDIPFPGDSLTPERREGAQRFRSLTCALRVIRFEPWSFRFPVEPIPVIDPIPMGPVLWQLVGSGLSPNRNVHLIDTERGQERLFRADDTGRLDANWWQLLEKAPRTLEVQIDSGVDNTPSKGYVTPARFAFQNRLSVPITGNYRDHAIGLTRWGYPALLVSDLGRAVLVDVSAPEIPRVVLVIRGQDWQFCAIQGGYPLLGSSSGIWRFDQSFWRQLDSRPVIQMKSSRHGLLVLNPDGIRLFDASSGQQASFAPIANMLRMKSDGNRINVTNGRDQSDFEVDAKRKLKPVARSGLQSQDQTPGIENDVQFRRYRDYATYADPQNRRLTVSTLATSELL